MKSSIFIAKNCLKDILSEDRVNILQFCQFFAKYLSLTVNIARSQIKTSNSAHLGQKLRSEHGIWALLYKIVRTNNEGKKIIVILN